ncbi:uncharacterized protein [Bactrocera oleae]|uniref:uncharacterized protein n=1 Tax=Bactrocera oleae TaxID=104688 RepID=UPI00387E8682
MKKWPFSICGQSTLSISVLPGKNGHIYGEMPSEFYKVGHNCGIYEKEKTAMGPSGGSPSTWLYSEKVHQIIFGFKSNMFSQLTLVSTDSRCLFLNETTDVQNFKKRESDCNIRALEKIEDTEKQCMRIEQEKADALKEIAIDNKELKNGILNLNRQK